jgi:nicotinamidase-related amidase
MTIPAPLSPSDVALLVIDVQERLMAAMEPAAAEELVRQVGILIDAARALGVPIVATEQYPKGLGPTVPQVRERLGETRPIEKLEFSAGAAAEARSALAALPQRAVIVCGVEAHVCVYQSAVDLLRRGYRVLLPEDAVLSRREQNRQVGLALSERAGAERTSVEAALFSLIGGAHHPAFKAISRLVR